MNKPLSELQDPRLWDMSVEDRKREWLRIMADAKPMPRSSSFKPKKQLYPIAAEKLEIYKRMRRETGAGLGDISNALREADGNYDKAKQIVIERNRGPKVLVNIKETDE